jgi:hypothetical protein
MISYGSKEVNKKLKENAEGALVYFLFISALSWLGIILNVILLLFSVRINKISKRESILNKLRKTSIELNEGWKPDWNNKDEIKWFIQYNYDENDTKKWRIIPTFQIFYPEISYFKTKKAAEKAIKTMKEDLDILVGGE